MAAYQESHRVTPLDEFFVDWQRDFGLTDIAILQLEAAGRYDVRIVRTPDMIRTVLRPGDRLLSATRITDLQLISFQYPLYLYASQKTGMNPRTLYTIDLTEDVTFAQPPYLILGQPVLLPAGRYRATFYLDAGDGGPLGADAIVTGTGAVAGHVDASQTGIGRSQIHSRALNFTSPGDAPLQFRLATIFFCAAGCHDAVD